MNTDLRWLCAILKLALENNVSKVHIKANNDIFMETETGLRKVMSSEYDKGMIAYLLDSAGISRTDMQIGNTEIEVDEQTVYLKVSIMNGEITITIRESLI